jgi:hypothetical protein
MKIPMTTSGTEIATFRRIAQWLNQLRYIHKIKQQQNIDQLLS